MDLGLCLACLGSVDSALAFVVSGSSASERLDRTHLLGSILPPDVSREALHLAAGGHKALFSLPLDAGGAVVATLARGGLPIRIVPSRVARAPLPRGLAAASALAVGVGCVVGWMTSIQLLVVSPVFGVLLWLLAQAELRRPVVSPRSDRLPFTRPVQSEVVGVLAALPAGRARDLLSDILRLARLLHERAVDVGDDRTTEDLGQLLELAARTASEVARLDEVGGLAGAQDGSPLIPSSPDVAVLEEAEAARARLYRCLTDALRVLGQACQLVSGEDLDHADLEHLAADVDARLRGHVAALEELDEMLASQTSRDGR